MLGASKTCEKKTCWKLNSEPVRSSNPAIKEKKENNIVNPKVITKIFFSKSATRYLVINDISYLKTLSLISPSLYRDVIKVTLIMISGKNK